jgi:endoglucanase
MTFVLKVLVLILFLGSGAHSEPNLKIEAWKTRPRGANIFSQITDPDLHFASGNKIRVLRIGAVGQHQDLRWLIKNDRFDLTEKNEAKLKSIVSNFTKKGFLVVLSLSELPGRRWRFQEKDFRIWEESKFQEEFINGWRKLAKLLKDDAGLIGYDLMNEPYFRNEKDSAKLNDLYFRTITAIREVDPDTPIVLQPSEMGSLNALESLTTFKDPKLIYSFHYYEPWVYFSKRKNKGRLRYPGKIPPWISEKSQGPSEHWDLKRHQSQLAKVKVWAEQRGLKPYQIFVGEFGVWKDAKGADQYLRDVLSVFLDHGWAWTCYAFRETGWENADLEKGPVDPKTQAPVLFDIIRGYLE